MNKTIFLIISLFLLVTTTVIAVPPFQISDASANTLTIIYPKIEYLTIGEEFDFHIHVINSSNGLMYEQTTYSCEAHIYNSSGSHILIANLTNSGSSVYDQEFTLNASHTRNRGFLHFNLWCNNTAEGGFVSGELEVLKEPFNPERTYYAIIGLFSILFFVWLLHSIIKYLDPEHIIIKVFFSLMTILFSVAAINIGLSVVVSANLSNTLLNNFSTVYRGSVIVLFIFFAYIIFYYVYRLFLWMKELGE